MVSNVVPSTSESCDTHTVPYSSERKNPQGKRRGKRKQGARLPETLKKSHNTNTELHYEEVTIASEGYKISLCSSKIQLAKPFFTSANTLSRQKPREKGRREGKRKGRGRRKRRREGKRKRGRKRKKEEKKKRYRESGT